MSVTITETCRCGVTATASATTVPDLEQLMKPFYEHREKCDTPLRAVSVIDRARLWTALTGNRDPANDRVVGVFTSEEEARSAAESAWEPECTVAIASHEVDLPDSCKFAAAFTDDGWVRPLQ